MVDASACGRHLGRATNETSESSQIVRRVGLHDGDVLKSGGLAENEAIPNQTLVAVESGQSE